MIYSEKHMRRFKNTIDILQMNKKEQRLMFLFYDLHVVSQDCVTRKCVTTVSFHFHAIEERVSFVFVAGARRQFLVSANNAGREPGKCS